MKMYNVSSGSADKAHLTPPPRQHSFSGVLSGWLFPHARAAARSLRFAFAFRLKPKAKVKVKGKGHNCATQYFFLGPVTTNRGGGGGWAGSIVVFF